MNSMTWAEYICQDLQTRIREGLELPEKITLQTLAKHYAVSATPVRDAISRLLDEKVLVKGSNNRLAVNPKRRGVAHRRLKKNQRASLPSPPEDHFKAIARQMVRLSLRGKSCPLRELDLAEQFGIGTRRVREILHRLSGLGVVEHLPRKGWRLVPFSEKALSEYIDARVTLELRALELAMPYLVRADLERLRDANLAQAASRQPLVIDNSLHRYILEKADNRYITSFFERHHPYFELLLDYETQHSGIEEVRQAAVKLHVQAIDALLAGNLDAAKDALRQDLEIRHPLLEMYRMAQETLSRAEERGHSFAGGREKNFNTLIAR